MVSLVGGSKDVVRIETDEDTLTCWIRDVMFCDDSAGIWWVSVQSRKFFITAEDARMLESLMVMAGRKAGAEFPA